MPTARTRSASLARAFADVLPATPSGAGEIGMVVSQSCLARHCFDHRESMVHGKLREFLHGVRIVHTAACNDQRLLGTAERGGCCFDVARVWCQPPHVVLSWLEELRRILISLGRDVLRQPEEGRSAVGGIEHDRQRLWQRLHDLFGPCNPIPVPGDGLEGVAYGYRRITEMLDLL